MTTPEVASRFNEFAQQEKWFEIQDELFADNVKSIEPLNSPYLENEEGKALVRKKADDFVKKIKEVYKLSTSQLIVADSHFAVAREMDLEVDGIGRVHISEIMLYEVKDGKSISEHFFY